MSDAAAALFATLLITSAAWACVAITRAAASGRLGRNRFAGLRLRWLMATDEGWQRGHATAVRPTIVVAILVSILTGVEVALCVTGHPSLVLELVVVGVLLVGLLVVAFRAERVARRVAQAHSR